MDISLSNLILARLEFFKRYRSEPVQRSFLIAEQRMLDILEQTSARRVLTSMLNVNIPLNWNEPVIVAPTAAQRDAAFEEPVEQTAIESPCSICQESLQNGEGRIRLRECHHIFHRRCATEWYSRSVYCPLCRSDIRVSNTIR